MEKITVEEKQKIRTAIEEVFVSMALRFHNAGYNTDPDSNMPCPEFQEACHRLTEWISEFEIHPDFGVSANIDDFEVDHVAQLRAEGNHDEADEFENRNLIK